MDCGVFSGYVYRKLRAVIALCLINKKGGEMRYAKIMVVDDDKGFSEELREILYLCGYGVRTVSESTHALKLARRLHPSAILLDLRMGGSSGFQVAQNLKDDKETAHIPIIAMSGYFPIEDRSILLDMHNMDRCIKKPFGITDLITEIESVLDTRTGRAAMGTG